MTKIPVLEVTPSTHLWTKMFLYITPHVLSRFRSKLTSVVRESDKWYCDWDFLHWSVKSRLGVFDRRNKRNLPPLGTTILLKPGVITGGTLTHECPLSRSIGYFLEPIVMLAPFCKKPLNLTLRGITTDAHDLSVGCTYPNKPSIPQHLPKRSCPKGWPYQNGHSPSFTALWS